MTDDSAGGMGLAQTLPEGVRVGENVPVENDAEPRADARIEQVVGELKARGQPYTEMSESELRERARRILDESDGGGA